MLHLTRAREPESKPERPKPHDLAGAGAILFIFFFQEPEHFKKSEWSRSWSRSWHKLVRLQLQQFLKIL